MPAATPHPERVLAAFQGRCSRSDNTLAPVAPICTEGPSRPTEKPLISANAPPKNWFAVFQIGICP